MEYKKMGTNETWGQTSQDYVLGAGYVTSSFSLLSCNIIFDFLLYFVEKVYYAIMLVHCFLRMKLTDFLQEI